MEKCMSEAATHASGQDEFPGIPELVLHESSDGSVTGVAVREMRSSYHATFAGKFAEPLEVEEGIAVLRRLAANDKYGSWKKELDVDATSLEEAIESSPESPSGQKFVLLYRGNEWLWGIWNRPNHPNRSEALKDMAGVDLRSVADFHGTRVSAAKRAARPGLDAVRANQTVAGPYQVLEGAIDLLGESRLRSANKKQDYEAHPAVRHLCAWWNGRAPEGSREAGLVRLYVWNEKDRIFNACDPEEPAALANQMEGVRSYALFEYPGMPTVLASFFRGRRFNEDDGEGGTRILAADGSASNWVGLDIAEVDEAYYSLLCLEQLAAHEVFIV